jgi:hypothetical protein
VTATSTSRRVTEARYRGAVYGLDVLDHHTGLVVVADYVGKTRQKGRARELQHRDTQPFSDRIVGSARVLWEGLCTEAELDEMERWFIQRPGEDPKVRPRLNYVWNEDNPHQVPKWDQVAQRHERDDAAGVPRWVPPDQRDRSSLLDWDTPMPGRSKADRVANRKWTRRERHLAGIHIGWAVLAVTAVVWLFTRGLLDLRSAGMVIAGAYPAAWWLWAGCPVRSRGILGWRASRARARRRLQLRRRR